MENENPWISVDDEMPIEHGWVLTWNEKRSLSFKHSFMNIDMWNGENWYSGEPGITHWQRIVGPAETNTEKTLDELEREMGLHLINIIRRNFSVHPKKPTSPMMVEAPTKYNTFIYDQDPDRVANLGKQYAHKYSNFGKCIWWNNEKYNRLWYWHNDQWNRAI